MSHEKLCRDYSSVGISLEGETRGGVMRLYVRRDGRTVFETTSDYEQRMFAEELYSKIERLTRPS